MVMFGRRFRFFRGRFLVLVLVFKVRGIVIICGEVVVRGIESLGRKFGVFLRLFV